MIGNHFGLDQDIITKLNVKGRCPSGVITVKPTEMDTIQRRSQDISGISMAAVRLRERGKPCEAQRV
jgi:hypothetical protein